MEAIFTDRFKTILKKSEFNLLSLLCCGALSKHEESREMIKNISNQYVFYSSLSPIAHDLVSEAYLKKYSHFPRVIFSLPRLTSS